MKSLLERDFDQMSAAAVLRALREHSEQIGGGCIMKGHLPFLLSSFTSLQVGCDHWRDCEGRLRVWGVDVGLVPSGICDHLFAGNKAVLNSKSMVLPASVLH